MLKLAFTAPRRSLEPPGTIKFMTNTEALFLANCLVKQALTNDEWALAEVARRRADTATGWRWFLPSVVHRKDVTEAELEDAKNSPNIKSKMKKEAARGDFLSLANCLVKQAGRGDMLARVIWGVGGTTAPNLTYDLARSSRTVPKVYPMLKTPNWLNKIKPDHGVPESIQDLSLSHDQKPNFLFQPTIRDRQRAISDSAAMLNTFRRNPDSIATLPSSRAKWQHVVRFPESTVPRTP